ncbi:MAG: hypothetical protein RL172_1605 [Bacteroidota bacterium]|jgi:hypothetical protein
MVFNVPVQINRCILLITVAAVYDLGNKTGWMIAIILLKI